MRGFPTDTTPTGEEYTHISKRGVSSFVPVTTTSPKEMSYSTDLPEVPSTVPTSATGLSPAPVDHTYPPANSLSASIESPTTHSRDSSWGVHVSSWLRMPSRRLLSNFSSSSSRPSIEHSASVPAGTAGGVSEVLTTHPSLLGPSRSSGEYGFFSILEAPESTVDVEMEEKFRTSFAFDEKEKLLGCKCVVVDLGGFAEFASFRLSWVYLPTSSCVWPSLHFYQLLLVPFERTIDITDHGKFSFCNAKECH